jgi:oligosaccharide repeat unit polymerase
LALEDFILLAVIIQITVTLAVLLTAIFRQGADAFEPIVHYILFFSLFSLPLPIRRIFTPAVEGNVSPFLPLFEEYLPYAVLGCAFSLVVFYLAYYSSVGVKLGRAVPQVVSKRIIFPVGAAIGLAALSIFLLGLLASSIGGISQLLLLGYGSTSELFGRGYLAVGLPWLFVAVLLLLRASALRRSVTLIWITHGLLIAYLISQLVMGNRGMIMYAVISYACYYSVCIRRLSIKSLALIAILGFPMLTFVGMIRGSNYVDFQDFLDRSFNAVAASTTTNDNSSFYYTLTTGEFVVPFETLPQIMRIIGKEEPPWFGYSYLISPVYLVPSAIFPERPPNLTHWYMQNFYNQLGNENEGRAFFFLSEAYLNFGLLGFLIIPLLAGWMWRAIFVWMQSSQRDPSACLLYALTLGFMPRLVAGDSAVLVSGLTQQSLSAAIVFMLLSGAIFAPAKRVRLKFS